MKMQQRKIFEYAAYKSQQRIQGQQLAMIDVNFVNNYGKLQNQEA